MPRIISKRYPVVNGDIDRAWLVDQLPRAKRPNILLEAALHPLPLYRIAAQAWISVDTLIDFMLGDDELTPYELHCLGNVLALFESCANEKWMLDSAVWLNDDLEAYASAIDAKTHLNPDHPATPLICNMLALASPPYAAVSAALEHVDMSTENLGNDSSPRAKHITNCRKKPA